jgi:hypothetical protein
MSILITGATGLIGGEIVKECHRNNIDVHYLTTSKNKIQSTPNYKGYYWNPDQNEIDLNCFENVTAIINLAGATISKRWTADYKKKILSSRVNSLRTLNNGLKKVDTSSVKSFVSASATGIYPDSITNFYEEDIAYPIKGFLAEVVAAWEQEANTFTSFNFSVAKIRIGLVMSDKGGALPEMVKPIQLYAGAPFGSGQQWQSWIHINDLARIFIFAVTQELNGVYNAVASNPVTNEKLTKKVAEVLAKKIIIPNIPAFILKLILGEMSNLLLNSQRVSNKKILEEGFVFEYQNVGNALTSLYGKQD